MSSDITLRLEKGTDLSYEEGDENFTHIRRIYRFTEDAVVAGGTANALTIASTIETQTSFVSNMIFAFIASADSTSTTPTLKIDGLDPKQIRRGDGTALVSGDIATGRFYTVRYNFATDNFWIMESPNFNTLRGQVNTNTSNIAANTLELTRVRSTQGVASGATNLGTFPGSLIPNNTSVKGALTALEGAVEDNASDIATNTAAISLLQGMAVSAVAGVQGSLTIPYSASNAILINWGSQVVGGNSTFVDTFATAYTQVYQGVVTSAEFDFDANSPTLVGLTNTNLTLLNGAGGATTIRWIAIGRLAI